MSPIVNFLQQTAIAAAPTNGLMAYWKLDETGTITNVSDSSNLGNIGSVKNGAIWTLGKLNN